jgi:hypothetical protein
MSVPGLSCCRRTPRISKQGEHYRSPDRAAVASGRHHLALGPSGDESFDVVALLSASARRGGEDEAEIGKAGGLGAATALGVLALVPAAQAQDFFSALFGGFGAAVAR